MSEKENCHSYCPYRKQCRYDKGSEGREPEDCSTYYKIEKIVNEPPEEPEEEDGDWYMIVRFILGMIAGAVGMLMIGYYYGERNK